MRLDQALSNRIDQARLLHWQPGRRITIDVDGQQALLRMSWLAADGAAMLPDDPKDPTVAGRHTIRLDGDLPPGVTATGWSALPETEDAIAAPSESEVAAAARRLGATHYERIDYPDGRNIWRMVGVGTATTIDRLRCAGEALYGSRWQSDLARALGVGDRRVREWAAGERRTTLGVWVEIAKLLRQRAAVIAELLADLDHRTSERAADSPQP